MENKEANMRLIKRILELEDGTYSVNTSNGNFNIRKNCSHYKENYNVDVYERDILIEDGKGNPFSRYYYIHETDYEWYAHKLETEIDYSNEFKLENGYDIDYESNSIKIYTDKEHKDYYFINKYTINKYENNKHKSAHADIENNTIYDGLLTIDLTNFDKIVSINNKKIIISKEKDIKEELNTYLKKIIELNELIENDEYLNKIITKDIKKYNLNIEKINDIKDSEIKLIKLYKVYSEAMKILKYTHDLNIMREIVFNLNPEFNKLYKKTDYIKKDTIINETLENTLLNLKCGLYFVKTKQGLIQIDILVDGYSISDELGNIIEEIKDNDLTNELIDGLNKILEAQKEEDLRNAKIVKEERIKKLKKELKMLENENK